jgi:hypothetical protein
MQRNKRGKRYLSLWKATKAIAVPVTFLMLFVSLTLIVSVTYYFAVTQININNQQVKVTVAKQRMLSFEEAIASVAWSPSAYRIFEFEDLGGRLLADSAAKRLVMNLTDDLAYFDVFFNSSIGKIAYQLSSSEDTSTNLYLRGDNRVVVNQTASTMVQLYLGAGATSPEIALSYRPLVGQTVVEQSGLKPTNRFRVYVLSLNSSDTMTMQGKFNVKITCSNVTSSWRNYDFSSQLTALTLRVSLDGKAGAVSLPISSNANGALVDLEVLVCNISVQSAGVY